MRTMSDAGPRRPSSGPNVRVVAWVSACAFLAVLALLALQMRRGRDPMLGAAAGAKRQAPRRVLVRKIVQRTVVVHLVPAPDPVAAGGDAVAASGGGSYSAPVAASGGGSAPAVSSSAAAPAAAPTPAPAPAAPAPVTRTS